MGLFSNTLARLSGSTKPDNSVDIATVRMYVSAVDNAEAAMMMIDRDLKITGVNKKVIELFRGIEPTLRARWPTFNPDKLMGECIDQFHTNPAHQRRLLADPSNLPFITDIELGEYTIALNVSAQYDTEGTYNGSTLVWEDVTEMRARQRENLDFRGQIEAIGRSQAVIEFNLDGSIINANDNFLNTVGYSLGEIKGQNHSMFVTSEYGRSPEYRGFWAGLNRGEPQGGEFERVGKGGSEIWLQATYNPIVDAEGKPYKVVKYATDISESKRAFAQVAEVLETLAGGNLAAKVNVSPESEFAGLSENINGFSDELAGIVGTIKESAHAVSSGAGDISQGNANLSARTEQQAASLEQTAASMDEITSTVQLTASNATRANELVTETQKQAIEGGEVVSKAITAMEEINESSNKIAEIIGVIDEIAFQTNLLALNASVEAARAGEQGRGFAVVASEVRNLAGRSATAAKEIKGLIEDSTKKVRDGSDLVSRSGTTLEAIVESVRNVTTLVGEISTGADEQSVGVSEVHKAIGELQILTQQNTAMVEEAAAASEELGAQSRQLNDLVGFFSGVGEVANTGGSQGGSERRSGSRPWESSAQPAAAPVAKKVANQSFNNNWKEF